MSRKFHKLEINTQLGKRVDFGPRRVGDVGRDIMVVKYALGQIEKYNKLIKESEKSQFDDPNGWFDNVIGKPVSNLEAARFDKTLQAYLVNFQLKNQLYMLSYYYAKYAIPDSIVRRNAVLRNEQYSSPVSGHELENEIAPWVSSGDYKLFLRAGTSISIDKKYTQERKIYSEHGMLSKQVELIAKMYNQEFGTIGEATLAILHGWLPRTKLFNKGYRYEKQFAKDNTDGAYDVVPSALFSSVYAPQSLDDEQPAVATLNQDSHTDSEMLEPRTGVTDFFGLPQRYYLKFWGPSVLGQSVTGGGFGSITEGDLFINEFIKRYLEQASPDERIDIEMPGRSKQVLGYPESYKFEPKHFGVMKYNIYSRPESYTSLLYGAAIEIENTVPEKDRISKMGSNPDTKTLSSSDYTDALMRMYDPDPLIDPDPYIIGTDKVGYFHRTGYTLENLPPIPSPSATQAEKDDFYKNSKIIREMENIALSEVLSFYQKPQIFYLDTRDPAFRKAFIGDDTPFFETISQTDEGITIKTPITPQLTAIDPNYNAELFGEAKNPYINDAFYNTSQASDGNKIREVKENVWVVSTTQNINSELEKKHIVDYLSTWERDLSNNLYSSSNPVEPLIKFVEFVTPSLRPGDVYRAKFIINKQKLDYIKKGYRNNASQLESISQDAERQTFFQKSSNVSQASIDGVDWKGLSKQDKIRRHEEYKAVVSKRKTEISRALREATFDSWSNSKQPGKDNPELRKSSKQKVLPNNPNLDPHSVNVNLGVFGNANLNFTGMVGDSYDYTTNVLGIFGEAIQNQFDASVENPNLTNAETLNIDFPTLKHRTQKASEYIKEAYLKAIQDKIRFNPSSYNGATQATLMSNLTPEVRDLIKKAEAAQQSQFDFGDASKAEGFFDNLVAESKSFLGMGDNITFRFAPANGGLKIIEMQAGNMIIGPQAIARYPSLSDPINVAYLAQIYDMAPLGGTIPFISTITDSCRDIGIGVRGLGYLATHTPGLSGDTQDYDPINQWYDENVKQPFNKWYKKSQNNLENIFEPNFDKDQLLSLFGKECTIEILYNEYAEKLSLTGLLCDFLRCIKLPGVNINIPNFNIPAFPKLSIFGWYIGLLKTLYEEFANILKRILCTFIRMILDFLKAPFCQEQLRDQLFGELASTSPIIQQAIVDGLTDLGLSPDSYDAAKDFADESLVFLTGDELCRLFNGERIDPAAMAMLERLAQRKGILELNTHESIIRFFETLGVFMPEAFCAGITEIPNSNWALGSTGPGPGTLSDICDDASDNSYVNQIRKRMLVGGATEEEIQKAIDLAKKNLQDQADKFQALGSEGLAGLLPELVGFGNPSAILNDLPSNFKVQTVNALTQLFEPARIGYISSLSNFGPSLFMDSPKISGPGDEDYDEESGIIISTILENLKIFGYLVLSKEGQTLIDEDYIQQLNALYQIYETTTHKGTVVLQAYKSARQGYGANFRPDIQSALYNNDLSNPNHFLPVSFEELSSTKFIDSDNYWRRPVGYNENSFFNLVDDDPQSNETIRRIENSYNGEEFQRFSFNAASSRSLIKQNQESAADYTINLEGFSFVNNYRILKQAESQVEVDVSDDETENLQIQRTVREPILDEGAATTVLTEAIKRRLLELQQTLIFRLQNFTKQKAGTEYLGGIKEIFNLATETSRENAGLRETVDFTTFDNDKGLLLDLAFGNMASSVAYVEKSIEGTNGRLEYEPYHVDIYNSRMFRNATQQNPVRIKVCDRLPGPGTKANAEKTRIFKELMEDSSIAEGQFFSPQGGGSTSTLYSRRDIFAKSILSNLYTIKQRARMRFLPAQDGPWAQGVMAELRNRVYSRALEGIFEQVFFSMRNSKIYDEQGYYPELEKRVAGQTYFDEVEGCYRNRFNVSQFGILSFEKIVTNELAEQMMKEMAKPENSPYVLRPDETGPIEKALQNVCLIGFVRICLVELLLKGALAYSVWGFEGVYDEPIIENFIFEYIKAELDRKEPMRQNWEKMITRVTGISNPIAALKKLVKQQSMSMLEISRKIYDHDKKMGESESYEDYMDWYVKKIIPQTHISRKISFSKYVPPPDAERLGAGVDTSGRLENAASAALINRGPSGGSIIWEHPLADRRNSNVFLLGADGQNEISYTDQRANADYAFDFAESNNPFFHIEHLLRVTGPLASLETLVFPAAKIVNKILGADGTPEQEVPEDLKTTVDDSFIVGIPILDKRGFRRFFNTSGKVRTDISYVGPIRDKQRLSIAKSLDRFTNLSKAYDNIEPYGFSITNNLPEESYGASLEPARNVANIMDPAVEEQYSYKDATETYNVHEFKQALTIKMDDGSSNKLKNHLAGLMDFKDPADPNKDDYVITDTVIAEAIEYPETIRRTPTRFIKKTRRIIKFQKDFISHSFNDFFDGAEDVEEYRIALNTSEAAFDLLSGDDIDDYHSQFKKYVSISEDSNEYYIAASNGERILEANGLFNADSGIAWYNPEDPEQGGVIGNTTFIESFQGANPEKYSTQHEIFYGEFANAVKNNNNFSNFDQNLMQKFLKDEITTGFASSAPIEYSYVDDFDSNYRFYGGPRIAISPGNDPGNSFEGITSGDFGGNFKNINDNNSNINSKDFIIYKPKEDKDTELVVFHNSIGKIQNEERYNDIKQKLMTNQAGRDFLDSTIEEHWVETVYEFSGDASILAGLYGSHTIGETFDKGCINFKPTSAVVEKFSNQTMDNILLYNGIPCKQTRDLNVLGNLSLGRGDLNYPGPNHYSYGHPYHSTLWIHSPEMEIEDNETPGIKNVNPAYRAARITDRRDPIQFHPYISRPMGINKHTNLRLTAKLLTRYPEQYNRGNAVVRSPLANYAPYLPEHVFNVSDNRKQDITTRRILADENERFAKFSTSINPFVGTDPGYRDICKIVHGQPAVGAPDSNGRRTIRYKNTDLLPPNVYKVPLRVLVTQVYVGGHIKKVYSKVIPPEYMKNMHTGPDSIAHPNVGALNRSLDRIMDEYNSFLSIVGSVTGVTIDNPSPNAGQISSRNQGLNRLSLAQKYFDANSRLFFPVFSSELEPQFVPRSDPYERSYLQPDSPVQFCSIERIYSEAFAQETRTPRWNSTEELDDLFSKRGYLMRRHSLTRLLAASDTITTLEEVDKIRALESFHYFYNMESQTSTITENTLEGRRAFHQTVFSLHNILQRYLRYRGNRDNSLWGAMTPENSSYANPVSTRGQKSPSPGKQSYPLVQYAAQYLGSPQEWSVLIHPPRTRGSSDAAPTQGATPEAFYLPETDESIFHGLGRNLHEHAMRINPMSREVGFIGGLTVNPVKWANTRFYHCLGTMTLMHDFLYETDAGLRPAQGTSMKNSQRERMPFEKYPTFSAARYFRPDTSQISYASISADSTDHSEDLIYAKTYSDGRGDYLVNYNRKKTFEIASVGSGLYYGDGRYSFSDVLMHFKTLLASVFGQEKGRNQGIDLFESRGTSRFYKNHRSGERILDLDRVFEGFYNNLFVDGNQNFTRDSSEIFNFLYRILSIDETKTTPVYNSDEEIIREEPATDQQFETLRFSTLQLKSIDDYLDSTTGAGRFSAAAIENPLSDESVDEILRAVPQRNRAGISRTVESLIETMLSTVSYMVEKCGIMTHFQTTTENVYEKNLFSEANRSLRKFELIRRILVKLKSTNFEKYDSTKKLGLLYVITGYDFADQTLNIFDPRKNPDILRERDRYERNWAKVCLYYFHWITAIFQLDFKVRDDSATVGYDLKVKLYNDNLAFQQQFEEYYNVLVGIAASEAEELRDLNANNPDDYAIISAHPTRQDPHYLRNTGPVRPRFVKHAPVPNKPGDTGNWQAVNYTVQGTKYFGDYTTEDLTSGREKPVPDYKAATDQLAADKENIRKQWILNIQEQPTKEQILSYLNGRDPVQSAINQAQGNDATYNQGGIYWADFNLCNVTATEDVATASACFEKGTPAYAAFQNLCALITHGSQKNQETLFYPTNGETYIDAHYKLGFNCRIPMLPSAKQKQGNPGIANPVVGVLRNFPGLSGVGDAIADTGLLGPDEFVEQTDSKWRYLNSARERVLAKFANDDNASRPTGDDVFGDAPTEDRYDTFNLGNMAFFLDATAGRQRGKFNYGTLSPGMRDLFPGEAAANELVIRPTHKQIIEWVHVVYDFLAERKPFDQQFFTTVMPHTVGRYDGIARSIESLYMNANPLSPNLVNKPRAPFDLSWDVNDSEFNSIRGRRGTDLYIELENSLGGDPRILTGDPSIGQIGTKPFNDWDKYSSLFVSPTISSVLLQKAKERYEQGTGDFLDLSNLNDDSIAVGLGRVEDILSRIDYETYYHMHFSPHFLIKMQKAGYFINDEDASLTLEKVRGLKIGRNHRAQIASNYMDNISKHVMFSHDGLYHYTTNKIKDKIANFKNYVHFTKRLKTQWIDAHNTFAGGPQALIGRLLLNADAIIGNQIVGGLLRDSIIEQVSRLVFNSPNCEFLGNGAGTTLGSIPSQIKALAEEERSIIMSRRRNITERSLASNSFNAKRTEDLIFSIPIAEVSAEISPLGKDWVACQSLDDLPEVFEQKTKKLVRRLMRENEEDNDPALFLKYLFPPKRFQALATIFATTTLNEYSTMPTIMEVPKSNMSFLMNTSAMTPTERMNLIHGMKQGDLYKGLLDNKTSDPRGIECFDLPFSGEFLDSFLGMLYEAIKEFPSLLFRGLASVMDPAYREMKLHYENCQIRNLTEDALAVFPARKSRYTELEAGTFGRDGNKKYSGLVSGASTDLAYGIAQLLAFNYGESGRAFAYLGKHLAGSIYKGPISLLDGAFQFTVPCADIDVNWPDGAGYNFGRYGHPISPLTILALMTTELRGDKRIRELSGRCNDNNIIGNTKYSRGDMDQLGECPNQEPAAFGEMPKPEDFDE